MERWLGQNHPKTGRDEALVRSKSRKEKALCASGSSVRENHDKDVFRIWRRERRTVRGCNPGALSFLQTIGDR